MALEDEQLRMSGLLRREQYCKSVQILESGQLFLKMSITAGIRAVAFFNYRYFRKLVEGRTVLK